VLIRLMSERSGELMRKNFLTRFTLNAHLTALAEALHSVEKNDFIPGPMTGRGSSHGGA
jgi:hypothetical protein